MGATKNTYLLFSALIDWLYSFFNINSQGDNMEDANIKVDVNKAIDEISSKLGIAADAIIPEYSKLAVVNGFSYVAIGLLVAFFPYTLFLFPLEGDEKLIAFIPCATCSIIGFCIVFSSLENFVAPKAMAMQKLFNDIRGEN
jgi:hypothetical protein